MIDDLLKLTLDKVFAPPILYQKQQKDTGLSQYQVDGTPSSLNMW